MKEYEENELVSEIWKPIDGFEGVYEVSNFGRIKSLPRNNTRGGVVKPYINSRNGYAYIGLSYGTKKATKRVHSLVMAAFNPCPYKHTGYNKNWTIDHKDGDKTNNCLSNLEWCSQSENQKRAFKMGLNPVIGISVIDLDTFEVYETFTQAARSVGGNRGEMVRRVCDGERSHYRNRHFARLSDYQNGTIPKFKGKNTKRGSEKLWR